MPLTPLEKYVQAAIGFGQASDQHDSERANLWHDEIYEAYYLLATDMQMGVSMLQPLLQHDDYYVRLWASTHLLDVQPLEAQRVLQELSREPGLRGLTAQLTLEQWKEGKLRFPAPRQAPP